MSFTRPYRFGRSPAGPLDRSRQMQVQERRSICSGDVCSGTLACPRCDAPVAAGEVGLALSAQLHCPFCRHQAPVRDFLSLASPTRPARVIVRVSRAAG